MKKEKIYEKAWYVYLAVIMAVVMYTIVSFGRPHTWAGFNSGVCYALSEGWSFQQGGQSAQQVSLPMKVSFSKEIPQVTISRRLPEQIPVGGYLEIPAPLDLVVLDGAVLMGVKASIQQLQRALHVKADGVFGPKTLAAARANGLASIQRLLTERMLYLAKAPTWKHHGRGWTLRTFALAQEVF